VYGAINSVEHTAVARNHASSVFDGTASLDEALCEVAKWTYAPKYGPKDDIIDKRQVNDANPAEVLTTIVQYHRCRYRKDKRA
jgi:hypothetical protein